MISGKTFFYQQCKKMGVEVPDGNSISGDVFAAAGVPMIVACTGCQMTMNVFSCAIDGDLQVWCTDCAGDDIEDAMERDEMNQLDDEAFNGIWDAARPKVVTYEDDTRHAGMMSIAKRIADHQQLLVDEGQVDSGYMIGFDYKGQWIINPWFDCMGMDCDPIEEYGELFLNSKFYDGGTKK